MKATMNGVEFDIETDADLGLLLKFNSKGQIPDLTKHETVKHRKHLRRFTAKEDAIILRYPHGEAAKMLNRTIQSVYNRQWKLTTTGKYRLKRKVK